MPFSTDQGTMQPATSATWCSVRIWRGCVDRQGEFDVGVDRLSGDGHERQTGDGDRGSFNALINATASFCLISVPDGASHANKKP
jgi:hypothetical protein